MKDVFYIVNIEIIEKIVTLTLSMNSYLSEYNDTDEFPMTELKLINPNINLLVDSIRESIDLYNDGFVFEIIAKIKFFKQLIWETENVKLNVTK